MDLWIRTQNNKILKVRNIQKNFNSVIAITKEEGIIDLGEYATEERALEVLDEIQNILKSNIEYVPIVEEDVKPEYRYKHYKSVGYEVHGCKFDSYVYEMPKE